MNFAVYISVILLTFAVILMMPLACYLHKTMDDSIQADLGMCEISPLTRQVRKYAKWWLILVFVAVVFLCIGVQIDATRDFLK